MPNHQYQSLVDLNPDRVFEEHTIPEIKEILKKLHAEIERKRVEIRTMVGYVDAIFGWKWKNRIFTSPCCFFDSERYRDLIQAADTIKEMKENSFEVISQIDGMSDMCKQLQQVHLLGFKQDSEAEKIKKLANFLCCI